MKTPLKQKRENEKLTQEALVCRTKIPLRTYQRYESKARKPDVETAILIADALKVAKYKEFKTLFGAATPNK